MSELPMPPSDDLPEETPPVHDESNDEAVDVMVSTRTRRRVALGLLIVLVVVPLLLFLTGGINLLAQSIFINFTNSQPLLEAEVVKPAPARATASAFTFSESDRHPDKLFQPYFGLSLDELPDDATKRHLIPSFRNLLGLYMQRQGEDDNFTVRVYDERNGKVLELYTLEDERRAFEQTGSANWGAIDKLRRQATTMLVKKYTAQGIPKDAVRVKWGRKNQVEEAREREAPFIEYEVKLSQYLGLSLLATEIGTVETFNNDKLISSVGARGRYQMMPYNLRLNNINHYDLLTGYGKKVQVVEEWHPLLTMEPAFQFLRGYVNAVGHEVPGISAYHTGPGNIFKVYRMYLAEEGDKFTRNTTVMDAYMWAVTEGYNKVSNGSSFGEYSRGYVPSGYGALRAVEHKPIDTTKTFLGERVQLKEERSIYLSDLLRALEESDAMLYWGPSGEAESLYERFRDMNPHIDLPPANPDGSVPRDGDVRLVSSIKDAAVRFFLPLNATRVLALDGLDIFDDRHTFRFDHNTYRLEKDVIVTQADREYEALLENIKHFGFSLANRRKLNSLIAQFENLAALNPSHYRQAQLAVARAHKQLWSYDGWETLAEATRAARGNLRLPTLPPDFPSTELQPPTPRTGR